MHHKGTKDTKEEANKLSRTILGAAIEVHRTLGPGLLESAYEECLAHELSVRGVTFERQKAIPLRYKSVALDCGYRLDLLVGGLVIVELKAIDAVLGIHEAQLLTYLRVSGLWLGILLNFNERYLRHGIRRIVN